MTDALQARSYANWMTIPELVRNDCLNALRDETFISPELLAEWRQQFASGQVIGGPMFHLFGGMSVRNRLRSQLTDGELPNGGGNWDDYYMGAIQALIEERRA